MKSMKKIICLFLAALLIIGTMAACSQNQNYLSWKAPDYNQASSSDKLECAKVFTNAALKAQGAKEIEGDELSTTVELFQSLLESGLAQHPDKTVKEIIDLTLEGQKGVGE